MGALFGFSGPPDETIARAMPSVLGHRAPSGWRIHETASATIGYAATPHAIGRGTARGLHVREELALVLCGFVTGREAADLAPAELRRRYRQEGISFVAGLSGQFVLVVLDGDTIHLARDGAGARSIYWGCHNGRFLFAVEPKGVLAAPGFPRRLRPAALAQYLTFSFIPGERTMLEDLHELPAGHIATWRPNRPAPRLERYFRFEEPGRNGAPPEELTQQQEARWTARFRDCFEQAVADRLPRDEPVGVFLSGGLDSSAVAAEVARQHARPVRTYSIHFGEDYPHELDFARAVARRCGTAHKDVLIRPRDFLPRLRRMVWHLDEPIGDPITMPNFELASRVSADVRCVFNGEGGDPCFGGPKNIPMLLHHWYGGIERARNFREQCYLASYRRGYEELKPLLAPDVWRTIDPQADLEDLLTPFFQTRRPDSFLDKLMAINVRLKGAHLILPKVERMTAAYGLAPLAPLFDERLVRLSFEMPPRMKLRSGVEKYVVKRAYADALPAEIIARPKSGMRVPVHYWFRGEMRRYARKILSPRRLRDVGLFDPIRVRQLLDYNTEEGSGRYGLRLWMLLTFEIWRRIVIDREVI